MDYTLSFFVIVLISFQRTCLTSAYTWNSWGEWSTCSVSCGNGIRSRVRTCSNITCEGPPVMIVACMEVNCSTVSPSSAIWSEWSAWSDCTRTCGGGNRTRTRTCSTGNASECCENMAIDSCNRESLQSRECINNDCYGNWEEWRPWSACSVSCGEGQQSRDRMCGPEGAVCPGLGKQSRVCYIQCPASENLLGNATVDAKPSCESGPCQNGAICDDHGDNVTCLCQGDWRGPKCESQTLAIDTLLMWVVLPTVFYVY
ncbi:thrombospondin-2-like isoform X2 [Dreissena polymorpha]|uniref:thrombospondin-2-like isoform X2 n=1 Tax=Dreissena polymorpha TaxID=45954 RepID=UPI002264B4A2|nr:thrombospondin-2-like isoform X2 [Dreissena polymorpha]